MNKGILNIGILASVSLSMLVSCDKKSQETHKSENRNFESQPHKQVGPSQAEASTTHIAKGNFVSVSVNDKLTNDLREIFSSRPAGELLSQQQLDRLTELIPDLRASEKFWDAIGAVPLEQLPQFREEILGELKSLEFKDGSFMYSKLANAYLTSCRLRDSQVAVIAFDQLQRQKPFVYPPEYAINGWPAASDTEYLLKGNQGILAVTVVELGDSQTMEAYRKMLVSASSDSQRVLIWALGRSPRVEDFELLIRLREKIEAPEIADTLIRSLNRIPISMEIVAKSPVSTSVEHRPAKPEGLLQIADSCRNRLAEMSLAVELTLGD
jgi:hypothetical protein